MTCRHFRFEVPREYADELRDADLEPCPVCDALPHRKAMAVNVVVTTDEARVSLQMVGKHGWFARWLGKRDEIIPTLPEPVRATA